MCVIVHNPMNLEFEKSELQRYYMYNGDGTGLYYYNIDTKKETVKKGEKGTDFNEIGKTVSKLHNYRQIKNVNLHFRYGTSGGLTERQIHPMEMSNSFYLMHNGVLPEFEGDPQVISDTQAAAFGLDNVLHKLRIDGIDKIDEHLKKTLSSTFRNNKVVLLQGDKSLIINEELGEGTHGMWRSFKKIAGPLTYGEKL